MSLSLSAKRHRDWVEPNPQAARLKNDLVTKWSPHVSLLGDFHTHPYLTLEEVRSERGFEFSEDDIDYFLNDDFSWECSDNNPVMLALTIAKSQRVQETWGGEWLRYNVWRYDIGEFRCWLNVIVGYLENDHRQHTGNQNSSVELDLNPRFYNESSSNLTGV